jgi:hypothetical protein
MRARYAVRRRSVVMLLMVLAVLLGAGVALVSVCADGGAMASAYRTCECAGIERQLYDATATDGPRRTLCIGIVRSRTCWQFCGGPSVACPGRNPGAPARGRPRST